MSGRSINIGAIDSLETQEFCVMIVRIFGSVGTQHISRVHLELVEREMDGWLYAWECLMRACMVAQLGRCDTMMIGAFTFGSILCAFFLERVIMLHPQVILDSPSMHDPRLM